MSVFSILCFLLCAFRIVSICLFILFIFALVFSVIFSCFILFLDFQIWYVMICVIVNVNFLVYLFVSFTLNVSICCCGVYVWFVSFVRNSWKCFHIFCIFIHLVSRCGLSSFSPQLLQFGSLSFERL